MLKLQGREGSLQPGDVMLGFVDCCNHVAQQRRLAAQKRIAMLHTSLVLVASICTMKQGCFHESRSR